MVLSFGFARIAIRQYLVLSCLVLSLVSTLSNAEIACGEPDWDRSIDSGAFVWRSCATGEWQVRMVAGGQSSAATFTGRVRANQPFTTLVPISVESNDVFDATGGTSLNYSLRVGSPWYDGFAFGLSDGTGACFELEPGNPGGSTVMVGPDRTPVTAPFNTETLAACEPAPSACGKPVTDSTDQGIFLWQDCEGGGTWTVAALAGGSSGPVTYTGVVTSSSAINNVKATNLEGNDLLDTNSPQQISFRMKTSEPWYDAFEFDLDAAANTCFDIASPAGTPLFIGAYKTPVTNPLELSTLSSCGGAQAMIDNVTASEGSGSALFTVSLTSAAPDTVTIDYKTVGDSAVAGADFVQTSGTLVFYPGELSQVIEVPLIQDAKAEGTETFSVVLSNPSGVVLSDATGIGTINDDEISTCGKPSFNPAVTEALFIWQDCSSGKWHVQVAGGGNSNGATFFGRVETDQAMTNLTEFSLESTDSLTLNAQKTRLDYQLTVWNKAEDGYAFNLDGSAAACFTSLSTSAGQGATVYLGAGKSPIATPFDLNTLGKCQSSGGGSSKPNFVVILTDDQRFDTLWAMPILQQKLQSRGMTFDRAYVTTPLCCPSRGAYFSGYYPYNTGVLGNPGDNGGAALFQDTNTLSVAMQKVGYQTQFVGKYLNGYAPNYVPPGWSSWTANNRGPAGDDWNSFDVTRGSSGSTSTVGKSSHIEQYVTNFHRDEVLSFLQQVGNEPFFIVMAPYAPHAPATPDTPDKNLFSNYVYRGRSYNESDLSDKPSWVANPNSFSVLKNPDDEFHRDMLRSLQAVDRAVGDIHDLLEQLGKLDNTVILYTSDNGFLWGEHSITEKGNPYEEALLVPLVIAGPGIPHTTNTEDLVSPDVDMAATVLDMAGSDRPQADGRSLVPLFSNANGNWRDVLIHQNWGRHWGAYGVWSAIFDGRWKFIDNPSGKDELYDLQNDPYEEENQINNSARNSIRDSLAAKLEANRGVSTTVFDAPDGKVGQSYSFSLTAWGGTPPYKWSVYQGTLPAGLSLNASGTISGTPTKAGSTTFKLKVVSQATAKQSGLIQKFVEDFTIVIEP